MAADRRNREPRFRLPLGVRVEANRGWVRDRCKRFSDVVSWAVSPAPNRLLISQALLSRGPAGPWKGCRNCCCVDAWDSTVPPRSLDSDFYSRFPAKRRSRNPKRSWLFSRTVAWVAEVVEAEDFGARRSFGFPGPIAVPISRMPDDVFRRTRAELFSVSLSTLDPTLCDASPDPDRCNAFVAVVVVAAAVAVAAAAVVASLIHLCALLLKFAETAMLVAFWKREKQREKRKYIQRIILRDCDYYAHRR